MEVIDHGKKRCVPDSSDLSGRWRGIGGVLPDSDGDMEALASLPTEVYTPPFLHQEQYDDIEEFLDDVSDWLSDEYGWCHFGFETETDDGGIIKCDTLPE